MATGKSNKWLWIVGGAILVAGGIGAYFLLRKKGDEEEVIEGTEEIKKQEAKEIGSVEPIVAPSELNSSEKIKAFQDWLDKYRPLWVNDNGTYKNLSVGTASEPNRNVAGKGYGTYGKNTNTAWKSFGDEYLKFLKDTSTNVFGIKSENKADTSKDVKTIINYGTGGKAEKDYLSKTNSKFVSAWAKSIRDFGKKDYFIFANQIYSIKTGDRILDYNPLGKEHYITVDKLSLFREPNVDSGSTDADNWKGTSASIVKDLKYNVNDKLVWAYIPNNTYSSLNKWVAIKYLSPNRPQSSFDGVKFEPMSSMDSFEITM